MELFETAITTSLFAKKKDLSVVCRCQSEIGGVHSDVSDGQKSHYCMVAYCHSDVKLKKCIHTIYCVLWIKKQQLSFAVPRL